MCANYWHSVRQEPVSVNNSLPATSLSANILGLSFLNLPKDDLLWRPAWVCWPASVPLWTLPNMNLPQFYLNGSFLCVWGGTHMDQWTCHISKLNFLDTTSRCIPSTVGGLCTEEARGWDARQRARYQHQCICLCMPAPCNIDSHFDLFCNCNLASKLGRKQQGGHGHDAKRHRA